MRTNSVRLSPIAISAVCLAVLQGCSSQLTMDVWIYDGPMMDERQARLSNALGLAKEIYDSAQAAKPPKGAHASDAELLEGIVRYYENLVINEQVERYFLLDKPSEAPPDPGKRREIRLANNLIAFCDYAQATSEQLGFKQLDSLAKRAFWIQLGFFKDESDYLVTLATIDESGRIARGLAGSVLAEWNSEKKRSEQNPKQSKKPETQPPAPDSTNSAPGEGNSTEDVNSVPEDFFLDQARHIMDSQSPGTLLTVIKNSPFLWDQLRSRLIKKTYDERYWEKINPVRVTSTGNSLVMLVRDEVGNFQLKNVSVDPTELLQKLSESARTIAKAIIAIARS